MFSALSNNIIQPKVSPANTVAEETFSGANMCALQPLPLSLPPRHNNNLPSSPHHNYFAQLIMHQGLNENNLAACPVDILRETYPGVEIKFIDISTDRFCNEIDLENKIWGLNLSQVTGIASNPNEIVDRFLVCSKWIARCVGEKDDPNDGFCYAIKELLKNAFVHGNKADQRLPIFIKYDKTTSCLEIINCHSQQKLPELPRIWTGKKNGITSIRSEYGLDIVLTIGSPRQLTTAKLYQDPSLKTV